MEALGTDLVSRCQNLALLDDDEKAALGPLFQGFEYLPGDALFLAGDPDDALFIVEQGKVRLTTSTNRGAEITLAELGPGASIGEAALVSGGFRSASAKVAEPTVVWRLGRDEFLALSEQRPVLRDYFERYLQDPALYTFLRRWKGNFAVTPQTLKDIFERLNISEVREGQYLIRQGEMGTDFYIVRSGTLRQVQVGLREEKLLGTLGPGDHIGDVTILTRDLFKVSVRAEEPSEVYSLDAGDFVRILAGGKEFTQEMVDQLTEFRTASRVDRPVTMVRGASVARGPRPGGDGLSRKDWGPLPGSGDGKWWRSAGSLVSYPFVEQAEEVDCGAAALAMMSQYYGARSALAPLRDLANVTKEGATLLSMASAAEQVNFKTWLRKFDFKDLRSALLPCICLWEGNHWVVVYEIGRSTVVVGDPAHGIRHLSHDEFAAGFSGPTLLLLPHAKVKALAGAGLGIRFFLPMVWPYTGLIWEVFLCAFVVTILGLSTPIFTSTMIDSVAVRGSTGMLALMLIGMVVIQFFTLLVRGLQQYLTLYASTRIDLGLVVNFYRHVLRLPARYFDVRKVGDVIARFEENEQIRKLFTGTPLSVMLSLFTVVMYVVLMGMFNPFLTLSLLAYLPVFGLITMATTPVMRRLSQEAFARKARAAAVLIESITGITTVKALGIEQPVRWGWQDTFVDAASRELSWEIAAGVLDTASTFLNSLATLSLLYFGAHQVMQRQLSVGQLMAFYAMIPMVLGPVGQLLEMWDELQRGVLGLERISEVMAHEVEQPPHVRARVRPMPPIRGHVRFEDVSFSYEPRGGRRHLDSVSFEALPGEMVAVVGRSGSGKTTLISLLMRLRDPQAGRILIDGMDIREAELKSLRRQIGVVMQENFLFSGSIRENICPDQAHADMDEIVNAAMLAGAHDFISALPMGYDTVVGERGASLSGGQRQRIAIARCLFRNPRILIFDEATSALDNESEKIIQANMGQFLTGRTSLVIAHRLTTIQSANKILVMDAGRIIESGTHQELMDLRGLYYYLNAQTVRES